MLVESLLPPDNILLRLEFATGNGVGNLVGESVGGRKVGLCEGDCEGSWLGLKEGTGTEGDGGTVGITLGLIEVDDGDGISVGDVLGNALEGA